MIDHASNDADATGDAAPAADKLIHVGLRSWAEALPLLVAVLTDGTAQGRALAHRELERMAAAADIGSAALSALAEFVNIEDRADGSMPRSAQEVFDRARQWGAPCVPPADTATADLFAASKEPPATDFESGGLLSAGPIGELAQHIGGKRLPLEICYSAAGFYLGTFFEGQPYSRESQYFPRRELAQAALANRDWIQRAEM